MWKDVREEGLFAEGTGRICFVADVEKSVHNLDTMNKNRENGIFLVQLDSAKRKSNLQTTKQNEKMKIPAKSPRL